MFLKEVFMFFVKTEKRVLLRRTFNLTSATSYDTRLRLDDAVGATRD